MNTAYAFKIGPLNFILNIQQSTIGYSYPRVFVMFPDDSYINIDWTLGHIFGMTEMDWMSWIDGTEIRVDDIRVIRDKCHECGFNWDKLEEIIFKMYEENK